MKTNILLLSLILFSCTPIKMVTEIKYDKPIEMPGKSKSELFGMSNAVGKARERCWRYEWVLDVCIY